MAEFNGVVQYRTHNIKVIDILCVCICCIAHVRASNSAVQYQRVQKMYIEP